MRTSLFFIPVTPSTTADNLPSHAIFRTLVKTHSLEPLPKWSLEHRLFRDTSQPSNAAAADQSKGFRTRYLQLVSLSHRPGNTYLAITDTYAVAAGGVESSSDPVTVVTIPASSAPDFTQLMISRFGPLWVQRQVVYVQNGQAFELGEFVIRFGDVRQGQGGAQQIKGTVVEIESTSGEDDAGEAIREFWTQLNVPGAKEFISVPGLAAVPEPVVQQWCDAMRLRA